MFDTCSDCQHIIISIGIKFQSFILDDFPGHLCQVFGHIPITLDAFAVYLKDKPGRHPVAATVELSFVLGDKQLQFGTGYGHVR